MLLAKGHAVQRKVHIVSNVSVEGEIATHGDFDFSVVDLMNVAAVALPVVLELDFDQVADDDRWSLLGQARHGH